MFARYNMFHRVNMHEMLMKSATGEGEGIPAVLKVNHKCQEIDHEKGLIFFENGVVAQHDLIVGADGIGVSPLKKSPEVSPANNPLSPQSAKRSASSPTASCPTRHVCTASSRPKMCTGWVSWI